MVVSLCWRNDRMMSGRGASQQFQHHLPIQPKSFPQQAANQGCLMSDRRCYSCGQPGHETRVCPTATQRSQVQSSQVPVPANFSQQLPYDSYSLYHPLEDQEFSPKIFSASAVAHYEGVAKGGIVLDNEPIPAILLSHLTTPNVMDDVFDVQIHSSKVQSKPPRVPVWSIECTVGGEDLLTVWDSGAVETYIPNSTHLSTDHAIDLPSDVTFVTIEGKKANPFGIRSEFSFIIGGVCFIHRNYVIERACFQLLLGTRFMLDAAELLSPSLAA